MDEHNLPMKEVISRKLKKELADPEVIDLFLKDFNDQHERLFKAVVTIYKIKAKRAESLKNPQHSLHSRKKSSLAIG